MPRKESTFLIIEINGRVAKAARAERLDWEQIRATLQGMYPGQTVYAPLQRAAGPLMVATVYLSRDRAGRARCSSMDQWGVA